MERLRLPCRRPRHDLVGETTIQILHWIDGYLSTRTRQADQCNGCE